MDAAAQARVITVGASPPLIIAHAAGNAAHVSDDAIADGADYLEVDLWVHRGQFETRHERRFPLRIPLLYERWYLSRARRSGGLASLFQACGTQTGVFLDLKGVGTTTANLIAAARAEAPAGLQLAASSQSWEGLRQLARAVPGTSLFYSVDVASKLDLLFSITRRDRLPRGTSCRHTLLTRPLVERLHDAGLAVVAWTVDDVDRARELVSWGVDAVTTHKVREMREALAAR